MVNELLDKKFQFGSFFQSRTYYSFVYFIIRFFIRVSYIDVAPFD